MKKTSNLDNKFYNKIKMKIVEYDKSFEIMNLKFSKLIDKIDELINSKLFESQYFKEPILRKQEHLTINYNNTDDLFMSKIFKLLADEQFSFWPNNNSFDSQKMIRIFEKILNEKFQNENRFFIKFFFNLRNNNYLNYKFNIFVDEFIFFLSNLYNSNEVVTKIFERIEIAKMHKKNLCTFANDPFFKKRNLYLFYVFNYFNNKVKNNLNNFSLNQENILSFQQNVIINMINTFKYIENINFIDFFENLFENDFYNIIPIDYHIPRSLYLLGFFDLFPKLNKLFEENQNTIFNERDLRILELRKISHLILNLIIYKLLEKYNSEYLSFYAQTYFAFNKKNQSYISEFLYTFISYNIQVDSYLFYFSKFDKNLNNERSAFNLFELYKKDYENISYLKVDTINF